MRTPPLTTRFVLASLNVAIVGFAFTALQPTDLPYSWVGYPLIGSPALFLLLAAYLSLADDTPTRHAVTTAATLVLVANLYLFVEVLRYRLFFMGVMPGPFRFGPIYNDALALAQYPTTLTALVPTAIGCWHRRQDRLAEEDPDS